MTEASYRDQTASVCLSFVPIRIINTVPRLDFSELLIGLVWFAYTRITIISENTGNFPFHWPLASTLVTYIVYQERICTWTLKKKNKQKALQITNLPFPRAKTSETGLNIQNCPGKTGTVGSTAMNIQSYFVLDFCLFRLIYILLTDKRSRPFKLHANIYFNNSLSLQKKESFRSLV